jgi:hypothetical protein
VKSVRRFISNFLNELLDGKRGEREVSVAASDWHLEGVDQVLATWPKASTEENLTRSFSHLRHLYRCGFRLQRADEGLVLLQAFFAGRVYRPDQGVFFKKKVVLTDLHLFDKELRPGQCFSAPAGPVLKAIGVLGENPDESNENGWVFTADELKESSAIQFSAPDAEVWIVIDSRPEVFRKRTAASVAEKMVGL